MCHHWAQNPPGSFLKAMTKIELQWVNKQKLMDSLVDTNLFLKKKENPLSQRSLGKWHIVLENVWVIFKYLLILISNIIPQW